MGFDAFSIIQSELIKRETFKKKEKLRDFLPETCSSLLSETVLLVEQVYNSVLGNKITKMVPEVYLEIKKKNLFKSQFFFMRFSKKLSFKYECFFFA